MKQKDLEALDTEKFIMVAVLALLGPMDTEEWYRACNDPVVVAEAIRYVHSNDFKGEHS